MEVIQMKKHLLLLASKTGRRQVSLMFTSADNLN